MSQLESKTIATRKTKAPSQRTARYRRRMRDAGLRSIQIWIPDIRSPDILAQCRKEAKLIAKYDAKDIELHEFTEAALRWSGEKGLWN